MKRLDKNIRSADRKDRKAENKNCQHEKMTNQEKTKDTSKGEVIECLQDIQTESDFDDDDVAIKSKGSSSSSSTSSSSSEEKSTPTTTASTRKTIPKDNKRKEQREKEEVKGIVTHGSRGKNKNNNKGRTNKTTNNTTEKKNKDKQKEVEKAWVSLFAIPKEVKQTAAVRELYKELARYATKAMGDREERKVEMGREEQELFQRWKEKSSKLELSKLHEGELKWEIREEGGKEREKNRLLTVELDKARKEVTQLKEIVGKQVENSKVDTEVVRRVEEYKREVGKEKEEELEKLKQDNTEMLRKLGGVERELELVREELRDYRKRRNSGRRGKGLKRKKKSGEEPGEGEVEGRGEEKVERQVGYRKEVGGGSRLAVTADVYQD